VFDLGGRFGGGFRLPKLESVAETVTSFNLTGGRFGSLGTALTAFFGTGGTPGFLFRFGGTDFDCGGLFGPGGGIDFCRGGTTFFAGGFDVGLLFVLAKLELESDSFSPSLNSFFEGALVMPMGGFFENIAALAMTLLRLGGDFAFLTSS